MLPFQFVRPGKSPAKRVLAFVDGPGAAEDSLKGPGLLPPIQLPEASENAGPAQLVPRVEARPSLAAFPAAADPLGALLSERSSAVATLTLSPLSEASQRLLRSPRKPPRKIPRNPYKVLDAPELQDDFYLNLIDWSSQNVLAVGLGSCVYLWNAWNSNVQKLCDLGEEEDSVTSVEWNGKGDVIAVGTQRGNVGLWSVGSGGGGGTRLANLAGHSSRVGCLAWNGDLVCSGSRDRFILQRDVRVHRPASANSTASPGVAERKLGAHKQEVCGLKWSPDAQHLASGGNDNQLLIWNLASPQPLQTYGEHSAAVKVGTSAG